MNAKMNSDGDNDNDNTIFYQLNQNIWCNICY